MFRNLKNSTRIGATRVGSKLRGRLAEGGKGKRAVKECKKGRQRGDEAASEARLVGRATAREGR